MAETSTRPDLWGSIERATGIGEAAWLELFSPYREASHGELAEVAVTRLEDIAGAGGLLEGKNLHWWSHGIAIAFEHHIGRRVTSQRCDGSFAASASKTLSGTMDEIADAWAAFAGGLYEVDGVAFADEEPRRTATEKWRYWRTELENGAAVSVNISAKSPAKDGTPKVVLAVETTKLNSSEQADQFKAAWKAVLAEFAKGV